MITCSLVNEGLINRIGKNWQGVTIRNAEVIPPRYHYLQDTAGSGRMSLCTVCQQKVGKFMVQGFPYCQRHCPCPGCTGQGDG